MILCARSISRSSELSTKRRSCRDRMRRVCLFYSLNNNILWLLDMADIFLLEFTSCAKVCSFCFLDCASRMLIGKLRSWHVNWRFTNVLSFVFSTHLLTVCCWSCHRASLNQSDNHIITTKTGSEWKQPLQLRVT